MLLKHYTINTKECSKDRISFSFQVFAGMPHNDEIKQSVQMLKEKGIKCGVTMPRHPTEKGLVGDQYNYNMDKDQFAELAGLYILKS